MMVPVCWKLTLIMCLPTGNPALSRHRKEGTSRIHTSETFLTNNSRRLFQILSGHLPVDIPRTPATVTSGQFSPASIPFSVSDYESGLNLQLWKSYSDEIEITLRHPNGTVIGPFQERLGTYRFTVGTTELLVYYGKPSPYSTSQEIYLDFIPRGSYIDAGLWELTLNPRRITAGGYDLWFPGQSVIGNGTGFLYPTEDTTLTIPSTASKVISVGAYNAAFNNYAPFSGRGLPEWNTASNRIWQRLVSISFLLHPAAVIRQKAVLPGQLPLSPEAVHC